MKMSVTKLQQNWWLNRWLNAQGVQMRHSISNILLFCLLGLIICGCTLDEVSERGSDCEAEYVWGPVKNCKSEECPEYNKYLDKQQCPPDAPMCILDDEGRYYCGFDCPVRQHHVKDAEKNSSECEPDSADNCGEEGVDCLNVDGHEGWIAAICNALHECEATQCQDSFIHTGNDCVTAARCCGEFCQDCTRVKHKVCSGTGKNAQCVDLCGEDEFECGGTCIDPQTSNTYCGQSSCNITKGCSTAQQCQEGKCVCLKEGTVNCAKDGENGTCVDIQSDASNCGECGNDCSKTAGWLYGVCVKGQCRPEICLANYHIEKVDGAAKCVKDSEDACGIDGIQCSKSVKGWESGRCENGRCVPEKCSENFELFDDACVKPGTECGDATCKVNEICEDGSCKCGEGYEECGDGCYDINHSVNHCGACGNACDVANAVSECKGGECVFTCNPGYIKNEDGTGCRKRNCFDGAYQCDKLRYQKCKDDKWVTQKFCTTDIDNAEPVCDVSFGCDRRCLDNYTLCGDDACYNLKTDPLHCGDCNTSCEIMNAENSCVNGVCHFECESDYVVNKDNTGCVPFVCFEGATRCNGITLQQCEDNEWKDLYDCSTEAANAQASCSEGACGYDCKEGYENCSGECVDLNSSPDHCSECGHKCGIANAVNTCVAGECAFSCEEGYRTTDDGSGCEVKNCEEGDTMCREDNSEFLTCTGNQWVPVPCSAPENGTPTCSKTGGCDFECGANYVKRQTFCEERICEERQERCDGDSAVQTCQDNKWVNTENCISPTNGSVRCEGARCVLSCSGNDLLCGDECRGVSAKGMAASDASLYTSAGSGKDGSVSKYSKLSIHGKSGDYFVINYNGNKRYISKGSVYVVPVTGTVHSDNGVNVREDAGTQYDKVHNKGQGIPSGYKVTITEFKKGQTDSDCEVGWFKISGNTSPPGPYKGYVCADYIINLKGSGESDISTCR